MKEIEPLWLLSSLEARGQMIIIYKRAPWKSQGLVLTGFEVLFKMEEC